MLTQECRHFMWAVNVNARIQAFYVGLIRCQWTLGLQGKQPIDKHRGLWTLPLCQPA